MKPLLMQMTTRMELTTTIMTTEMMMEMKTEIMTRIRMKVKTIMSMTTATTINDGRKKRKKNEC